MKGFLWLGLFLAGLWSAIALYPGLAGQGSYDSLILDFDNRLTAQQIEQLVKPFGLADQLQVQSDFSRDRNLYILQGDAEVLKTLRQSARGDLKDAIERIEPNYQYHTALVPNDPEYSRQWNLRAIGMESAWRRATGKGVTVAVIDTGITPVPDLNNTRMVEGYNFVNHSSDASDDNGHGTHVAGTIAQATNNGYGVAGIAFDAALMPLKVLGAGGGGTVADIAEAIRYAADHDADVINLSLGGAGDSAVLREAIDYAHNKGLVIVAAAGNEGRNAASYPARYPHVIAVAATGAAGDKAPYSNYGAGVDIAAPGGVLQADSQAGGIWQETLNPQTGEPAILSLQGTSMASPHVAGVAALIKAIGVEDPDDVAALLKATARQASEDPFNYYGAGGLDAASATAEAEKGQFGFRDFFRWLRESGYLSPKFWIDGGVIAFWPKVLMVVGAYLLSWLLRVYWPFAWSWPLSWGLILGSSGLFGLQGLYIFDLPQWPLRIAGSSIAELGNIVQGSSAMSPIFASVLIPFGLVALLLGHPRLKWFAIGTATGMTACLAVSAIWHPALMWLGAGLGARLFLLTNGLLCWGLAYFATKAEVSRV